MKKRIIPIILLLVTLSYLGYKKVLSKTSNENTYYGIVEVETVNASFEIAGRIKEIFVQEGQEIKEGDKLASLYSKEGEIKFEMANLSKEGALNELDRVKEGSRREEIDIQKALVEQAKSQVEQGQALLNQARNNLNIAKINLDYKRKIYEDYKELYDKNSISKFELDNAKNQLDLAEKNYVNAKEQLNFAQSQVESFNANLKAQEAKLKLLTSGATDNMIKSASIGAEQAEKNLELSKINIDKYTLTSPIDGIVETVNYNKGEFLQTGSPIVTILDKNNMYVKIFVPEKVLPDIKLGQNVILKSDFMKDKNIKGEIVYISPEAEFTPMNIVTKEDRTKLVFAVKVKILDHLDSVKPGMLLDVLLD
ncbi:HlyD family secretion protein [Caloramator australicus]|uniref:HlyD family secretion protein n=2 Tax=Caloramator TaxID=44258 RepID=I7J5Y2_9CLOT|nr:HlyD family efflux transporter periplasmic adaptor subunit [Caloramator australicus]CCJ34117.1 HlyD family secretion protein [Caloramator australicus RC3]